MIITNHAGLPEAIVKAITNREYSKGNADISVTSLLTPPQLYQLMRLYGDQVEVEASTNLWSLFGSAVHNILAQSEDEGVIAEQRLYMQVADWMVSGQPDYFNIKSGSLEDYKVTSVSKVLYSDYADWEFQLNVYALMIENTLGHKVNSLQINAILKDWSFQDAHDPRKPDYPKTPIVKVEIERWRPTHTLRQILDKMEVIQNVANVTIDRANELPHCTVKDRWGKLPSYTIKRKADGYTYRRYQIEDETEEAMKDAQLKVQEAYLKLKTAPDYDVVLEEGKMTRCEYFCPVKKFCPQYNGKIVAKIPGYAPSIPVSPDEGIDYDNLTLPEVKSE